jgi:hypothetical protein
MTPKEHELMVMMFARLNEAIGIIGDSLVSRGIWSGDDSRAFAHAAQADDRKLDFYFSQALKDYRSLAAQLGVVTGLKS